MNKYGKLRKFINFFCKKDSNGYCKWCGQNEVFVYSESFWYPFCCQACEDNYKIDYAAKERIVLARTAQRKCVGCGGELTEEDRKRTDYTTTWENCKILKFCDKCHNERVRIKEEYKKNGGK